MTVLDAVGNSSTRNLTVHRQPAGNGVAVIVGGRNDVAGLQTNISYLTNRAYRLFLDAGFAKEKIRYLSTGPQDADTDGANDVYTTTTPAAVHEALQWAAGYATSSAPFFLYLMDHGMVDAYCATGCPPADSEGISPTDLDAWLDELEAAVPGVLVNVIIEACHSGSFIENPASISQAGRVVIASTGTNKNAYASAQGAFFSDAFFTTAAAGGSLLTAFNNGKAAVVANGVDQTPWLDDDANGTYTGGDGAVATARYLSTNFGTVPPTIDRAILTPGRRHRHRQRHGAGRRRQRQVGVGGGLRPVLHPAHHHHPVAGRAHGAVDRQRGGAGGLYGQLRRLHRGGNYRVVVYAVDDSDNEAMPKVACYGSHKVYCRW